ncbi:MAG: hypothetical protein SGILL_006455 [Bacillariaceae sp.]
MADDASYGSDEWGMEELVIPPKAEQQQADTNGANDETHASEDDDWGVKIAPPAAESAPETKKDADDNDAGEPMIIVDMTQIDSSIHSKFDKNSVSDSAAASALRKKIEASYDSYAKDATRISDGTGR